MVTQRLIAKATALACLTIPAAVSAGCKSRQVNRSNDSAAKDLADDKLAKSSDLDPSEYFEKDEAKDAERFKESLLDFNPDPATGAPLRAYRNNHYQNDFAVCEGYPSDPCKVEDLKRGISGPLMGRLSAIDARVAGIDENLKNFQDSLKRPDIDADTKEYFEHELKTLENQRAALIATRPATEAAVKAILARVTPLVEANAKAIDASVAAGFSFANPVSYVRTYLDKVGRTPKRIAATTVLKYMRQLRKNTYVWPADGDLSPSARERRAKLYKVLRGEWTPDDPGEADPKKAKDAEERQRILDYKWFKKVKVKATREDDAVLNDQDWIPDVGDDAANGTLGATPPHWNDLQSHYYAVTGHRRHGCYATVHRAIEAIRDESLLPELIEGEGRMKWNTIRDTTVRFCTSEPKSGKAGMTAHEWAVDERKVKAAVDKLLADPTPEISTYYLELAWKTRPFFRKMWHTQTVRELKSAGLNPDTQRPYNVFDYVMLAPVWSQNFDQQQAIINAFYHGLVNVYGTKGVPLDKPSSEPVPPYIPGSALGCGIRPLRRVIDEDEVSVCSFDRDRKSPIHSIGR